MTMTYKELRENLERHGLWAKKSYGQHFLHQQSVLKRIGHLVEQNIPTGQVVEIGPGPGPLTSELYELLEGKKISTLSCVEKDQDMKPLLEEKFPKAHFFWQDALKLPWVDFQQQTIVGNLPYNISVPFILQYCRHSSFLGPGIFMIQKEVAQRLNAKTSSEHYGRLSVMVQCFCKVSLEFLVPPDAFFPKPKVDSAVVLLKPHFYLEEPEKAALFFPRLESLVALGFSQRRKQILNTLKPLFPQKTKEEFTQWLMDQGFSPKERAENISLQQWCSLLQGYEKATIINRPTA